MALSEDKRAELLYNEWEYRHGVIWKTVQLWGAVAVFAISAPFLQFGGTLSTTAALLSPFFGLCLAWIGAWNIQAEYARLAIIYADFESARGPTSRITEKRDGSTLLAAINESRIGSILTRLFFFGLGGFAIAAACIVMKQRFPMSPRWSADLMMLALLAIVVGLLGCLDPLLRQYAQMLWNRRRVAQPKKDSANPDANGKDGH